jgi:predicted acyl esterase
MSYQYRTALLPVYGITLVRSSIAVALLVIGQLCMAEPLRSAPQWQPDPPTYEFGLTRDLDVQMDDGVHLRADVYYPVDPTTKKRASGKFPVLLEQTPYGKDRIAGGSTNTARYFVSRGYIFAIADLRGFGNSQGQAAWFGSRTGRDGAELVDWSVHLENASGKVGLMGCSYSGVAQYFTANSLSVNSHVKAMAPFCTDSNFYRDLTAFGGIPTQFIAAVRALTPPGVDDDPATDPFMQTMISQGTGENAYYNEYWNSVNVTRFMPKIVSLGIPILSETGWYDLFPGGNIDANLTAQSSLGHRPLAEPLHSGNPVSGRYQAIVGPWTHGEHTGDTLQQVLLEWFDTWLKGKATGIADTKKPLHLYVIGANRWIDSATYPLTDRAVTFHLSPGAMSVDGARTCVRDAKPATGCSAPLIWAPEFEGTTLLTFDSPPLDAPLIIGGPGDVTIYLKSTKPEIELTATLLDVSPDGTVTKVTDGAQLGSQRELDPATSWYSGDGKLIRPSHYFTKEKSSAVPIGNSVRLDIELVPIVIRISAGHRLRLKLISEPAAAAFHQYWKAVQMPNPLAPTPQELENLIGGAYTILFGSEGSSVVNLSTASDAEIAASTADWGPND